jgi:hypothetical protein
MKNEGCCYPAEKLLMYSTWNYRVYNFGVKQAIVIAAVKCRFAKIGPCCT